MTTIVEIATSQITLRLEKSSESQIDKMSDISRDIIYMITIRFVVTTCSWWQWKILIYNILASIVTTLKRRVGFYF